MYIIGHWHHDYDNILLTNCNNKIVIWINRWTHWASHNQPTHFRRIESSPSNSTWVAHSGYQWPGLPNGQWFGLDTDPDWKWQSGTVANTSNRSYSPNGKDWCTKTPRLHQPGSNVDADHLLTAFNSLCIGFGPHTPPCICSATGWRSLLSARNESTNSNRSASDSSQWRSLCSSMLSLTD
jgi:hypothetical protein